MTGPLCSIEALCTIIRCNLLHAWKLDNGKSEKVLLDCMLVDVQGQGWAGRSGYSGECRKDRLHKVDKALNSEYVELHNVSM